jgi:hypothetical protein
MHADQDAACRGESSYTKQALRISKPDVRGHSVYAIVHSRKNKRAAHTDQCK